MEGDRPEEAVRGRVDDRERRRPIRPVAEPPSDEVLGVVTEVWLGERDPARDLGILAGAQDRVGIVDPPRPELDVAVPERRIGWDEGLAHQRRIRGRAGAVNGRGAPVPGTLGQHLTRVG